jgi:uncharacterized membrane protein SirB2
VIEYYVEIRSFHVWSALASVSLFVVRATAIHAGASWGMAAPLRYLSYAIDSALLTAALMLVTITHQYPFVQPWLTVKVVLVVAYIVLGSFALKRGRTRGIRIACTVAAILVFALVYSIARSHSPWGPLAYVLAGASLAPGPIPIG